MASLLHCGLTMKESLIKTSLRERLLMVSSVTVQVKSKLAAKTGKSPGLGLAGYELSDGKDSSRRK
jgi:hypothetical protein